MAKKDEPRAIEGITEEVDAMRIILLAVEPLDQEARMRVLTYCLDRTESDGRKREAESDGRRREAQSP